MRRRDKRQREDSGNDHTSSVSLFLVVDSLLFEEEEKEEGGANNQLSSASPLLLFFNFFFCFLPPPPPPDKDGLGLTTRAVMAINLRAQTMERKKRLKCVRNKKKNIVHTEHLELLLCEAHTSEPTTQPTLSAPDLSTTDQQSTAVGVGNLNFEMIDGNQRKTETGEKGKIEVDLEEVVGAKEGKREEK